MLEAAAPPSLVVDERWNVLHLSASVSRFLQQSGGAGAARDGVGPAGTPGRTARAPASGG
jgi:hypothetical protein